MHTALNTALTPIMREFGIPAGTVQWLSSAYSLSMGVMVLATAFLIRRFHGRPLFLIFMGVFSIGLLLTAVAGNFPMILLGRILQAIGSGLIMSLSQVVILSAYPVEERGSVMGLFGLAISAAPVLSPTLAGIVTDLFGWRMIFWGSLFLSLLVLTAGFVFMKNITHTEILKFDLPSILLCSTGFVGVVVGLGNLSRNALLSLNVLGPVLVSAILLTVFVRRQLSLQHPFLDMSLFRNHEFRVAVLSSMVLYGVMIAVSTLIPIYNQSMRGFTATVSGLITMPGSLLTALVSPIAGRLYDRMGMRLLFTTGSLCVFIGHFALCFLTGQTPIPLIMALISLRQIGIGLLLMTMVTWGMSTLASKQLSDGTAILSSLRTVAGAIGSAAFIALMTGSTKGSDVEAMIQGVRVAFIGISVLSALLVYLAVFRTGSAIPGVKHSG